MFKKYLFLIVAVFLSSTFASNTQANEIPIKVATQQQYLSFLEQTLASSTVDAKIRDIFYQRSNEYWSVHKIAYNLQPEKYQKELSLFHKNQQIFKQDNLIKIDRFEESIELYRRFDKRNSLPKNPILFVGSSSIVYWETSLSFPQLPVINRGFGGASIAEIIHYYNDVVKKHSPSIIVMYSDIDVENGISPSVAVKAFKTLVNMIKQDLPNTQVLLISMKPTLVDDFIGESVSKNKKISNNKLFEYSNSDKNLHYVDITLPMLNPDGRLRADIFLDDGMHLNSLGYTLWTPIIRKKLELLTQR